MAGALAIGSSAVQADDVTASPAADLAARLDSTAATEARSARNASYAIDVKLDTEGHKILGHEVLRYRNMTSDPMPDVQLHLYLNAFKNLKSTFMRESGGRLRGDRYKKDGWGYTDVSKIVLLPSGVDLTKQAVFIRPDDDNADDQTVLRVPLPEPVAGGETVELEIAWEAKLPRVFARTGYAGSFVMVGQWFPKAGVFQKGPGDDKAGWNCHQFHASSEFFGDYGIYDVRIQAPAAAVVGACGRLVAEAEATKPPAGFKVSHYRAEDVHDFAFTADPDFREAKEQWREVEIRLLYQPEHEPLVRRHLDAARASLEFFDRHYGPYPYTTLTIVDPGPGAGGAGGMEYPTLITGGTRYWTIGDRLMPWLARDRELELVVMHEFGHQYWYGLVGSNEFEEAWLDEGFNSFSETEVLQAPFYELFGGRVQLTDLALQRGIYVLLPHEGAILERSWKYPSLWGYGVASYMKPATVLRTFERLVGEETMDRIMKAYFARYAFHHPRSEDFFAIVADVTGKDYGWFWDQFVRRDLSLDYAVRSIRCRRELPLEGVYDKDGTKVTVDAKEADKARKEAERQEEGKEPPKDARYRTTVLLERREEGIVPVDYEVHFGDGSVEKGTWDGRARALRLEYVKAARGELAVVDPSQTLLIDVDLTNNARYEGGDEGPGQASAPRPRPDGALSKAHRQSRDIASRLSEAMGAVAQALSHALALLL